MGDGLSLYCPSVLKDVEVQLREVHPISLGEVSKTRGKQADLGQGLEPEEAGGSMLVLSQPA